MTDEQWDRAIDRSCGMWGLNREYKTNAVRIEEWERRYKHESYATFMAALDQLADDSPNRVPSVGAINHAIGNLKRSERAKEQGPQEQPVRLTPADRRDTSRKLLAQVEWGLARTNGKGTRLTAHLQKLAELYEENAWRSERGERLLPVPPKDEPLPFGLNPNAADEHAEARARREREVEVDW